jgi:hypothetical protein
MDWPDPDPPRWTIGNHMADHKKPYGYHYDENIQYDESVPKSAADCEDQDLFDMCAYNHRRGKPWPSKTCKQLINSKKCPRKCPIHDAKNLPPRDQYHKLNEFDPPARKSRKSNKKPKRVIKKCKCKK